ncbi:hypothetical protein D1872_307830 [compost metagenome]
MQTVRSGEEDYGRGFALYPRGGTVVTQFIRYGAVGVLGGAKRYDQRGAQAAVLESAPDHNM